MNTIKKISSDIINYKSRDKLIFDKYIDSLTFKLLGNTFYIYGLNELIDLANNNLNNYEDLTTFGIYASGIYFFPKFNRSLLNPISREIKDFYQKRFDRGETVGLKSFIRSMGEAFGIGMLVSILNFGGTIDDYNSDFQRIIKGFSRNNLEEIISSEKKEVSLGDKKVESFESFNSYLGKYQRVSKWKNFIKLTEEKYNIQENLIAGLMMLESGGEPLKLSDFNDGGAGLMQFQPGTAQDFGLKTFGTSSKTGRDTSHGKKLTLLVEENNFDIKKLSKVDERFDPEKSINAAGKYLSKLHNRYKNWDKVLSAYNAGRPVKDYKNSRHVQSSRKYQRYYECKEEFSD